MPEQQLPKRARISYRETPDNGLGKVRTVHEIRTAKDAADLHEQFWKNPSWPIANTRKIEILNVDWLDE
jgi:hypothetical protein